MHTGSPSEIRLAVVGNNELKFAFDYIRFFLVFTRRLGLRQLKSDGSMWDATIAFADRFEYLDSR